MKIKKINLKDGIIIKKVVRYTIGGGLAALLDLLLLRVFTDIFKIYYIYSAILSFVIIFYFGFIFQKYITFQNKERYILKQGLLFLIFQLIGILINLLLLWIGVSLFKLNYMYVAVFNKGLIFIWNFVMNYIFTFKYK